MAYVLAGPFAEQFEDANGNPLVLGTVELYIWNTTTPTPFYTDSIGTSGGTSFSLGLLGQPVNGSGVSIQVFFDSAITYKIIRKDAAGTVIPPTLGPYSLPQATVDTLRATTAVTVNSIAALKAVNKTLFSAALVTGYYAAGDGGGGNYRYDATDTTSTDNGGTVIVASDGGRWKLIYINDYTVKQFGAKGDGVTDDTSVLNALFAIVSTLFGDVFFPKGIYCITAQIIVAIPCGINVENGAVIKWIGAAPGALSSVIKIGNDSGTTENSVAGFNVRNLVVDSNHVNNVAGFYFATCRYSAFNDLTSLNADGTNGYAYYLRGGDTHGLNVADNVFKNLIGRECLYGMSWSGPGGTGTEAGVTVNEFFGLNFFGANLVIGLIAAQNCDSNFVYGLSAISQSAALLTGVIFNNGASKTTTYHDVSEIVVDGLIVSGGLGGATGVEFNYCERIRVRGARISAGGGVTNNYTNNGPVAVNSFSFEDIGQALVEYLVSPPPTAVAGAGAGTAPPAPVVVAGANYRRGQITFGTGTTPGTGVQVTVTLPAGLAVAAASVKFTPANGATWDLKPVPVGVFFNQFQIFAVIAPAASQANTTYSLYYDLEF